MNEIIRVRAIYCCSLVARLPLQLRRPSFLVGWVCGVLKSCLVDGLAYSSFPCINRVEITHYSNALSRLADL